MKKVLAVVFAVAVISFGASVSNAQVPNVVVYFDDILQEQQGFCADHFVGQVDTLNVVYNNFNAFINTVEFAVDFTSNDKAIWLGDVQIPAATLFLGTSSSPTGDPVGISINYQIPQNGFDPFIAMGLQVVWQCASCDGLAPQAIAVVPHTYNGGVIAVEFQTNRIIEGVGMTSLICPGSISTQESSWGKVKALYGN